MTERLLEAVPNFSEGRDPAVVGALADAVRGGGARLLRVESDPDHHRSVLTFVGAPDALERSAFAAAAAARDLIDLARHRGRHPRMGALDVLPFVPLRGAAMDEAVDLARRVGRRIGEELGIPVFLYEHAAGVPARRNLADLRAPRFEGLRDLVGRDPAWTPDFGPARIHPSAGASAVGARPFLVAFNVDLASDDLAAARRIASRVRARDGGLPGLKALGLRLERRGCVQVSMNLCDLSRTGLLDAFRAVEREAAALGIAVAAGELVGLVPRDAFPPGGERLLRLRDFDPSRILENGL
jgi:glutamate formiminotransferase